jgi:hypothetical protein
VIRTKQDDAGHKDRSPKRRLRKQIRGTELQARINEVIRSLARDASRSGHGYVYNASEVGRLVPATRRTLAKHDALITKILNELAGHRRVSRRSSGAAEIEALKVQNAKLRAELAVLRRHHTEIYDRLRANSVALAALIAPWTPNAVSEAAEAGTLGDNPGNVTVLRRPTGS